MNIKTTVAFALSPLALLAAAPVMAQLEEVVVTAEKREESANRVPTTLQVLDQRQLQETGADVASIASQVSNVQFTTSANLPSYSIRGVGLNEFQTNFDSPVGVSIDEVYQSKPFMMSMPTYDVNRVEVLKGPQGTLFGRNTIGGAVNYYLNEPTADLDGRASLTAGRFGRLVGDAFLNTPLTDRLSMRLSTYISQATDGPYTNLYDGHPLDVPRITEERAQLKWTGDGTSVLLLLYGGQDHSSLVPYKAPGIFNANGTYCPAVLDGTLNRNPEAAGSCYKFANLTGNPAIEREPSDPYTVDQQLPNSAHNETYGGFVRILHETSLGTLTSLSAYEYFQRRQNEDADGSPLISVQTTGRDLMNQVTEDLHLSGEADRFKYVAGLYYEHDLQRQSEDANLIQNPFQILPPADPRLGETLREETNSAAGYLNVQYAVLERVSLVGGMRYTVDALKFNGRTFLGAPASGPDGEAIPVVPVDSLDKSHTYTNFSYRAGVNFTPAVGHLVYFNYSTGYRSGGVSVPFGGLITEFAPEQIKAYELGWKGSLVPRILQIDAALFRYDYSNLQVNVDDPSSPLVPVTRNIGEAVSKGAELELTWAPDSHWALQAGAGYLDATYTKTDRTVTTYGGTIPLLGKPLVNTPHVTLNGQIRYGFDVTPSWRLSGVAAVRYTGERSLRPPGQPYDMASPYAVTDLRLALESSDEAWEFALWGKNVFDRRYLTYVNNVSFFKINIYGEPATFGATVARRF